MRRWGLRLPLIPSFKADFIDEMEGSSRAASTNSGKHNQWHEFALLATRLGSNNVF
jgi:hypothetical protein